MFKRKCKCNKSEKNFKMDIGPFFVNECCVESGYDELGNKKESIDESANQVSNESPKLKKGELNGMKVAELKDLAKSLGMQKTENMTKKLLIEALLK